MIDKIKHGLPHEKIPNPRDRRARICFVDDHLPKQNKSETTKPNGRAYDNAYGIISELRYKKVFEDISKA